MHRFNPLKVFATLPHTNINIEVQILDLLHEV